MANADVTTIGCAVHVGLTELELIAGDEEGVLPARLHLVRMRDEGGRASQCQTP